MTGLEGWWFGVRDQDGEVREVYGEQRIVRVGETLVYNGTPAVCLKGLHACPDPLIALCAAPSAATVVCRVRLGGLIAGPEYGKYAAQRRTVLWAADCEAALRRCATDYAERVPLAEITRAYTRGEISIQVMRAAEWAVHIARQKSSAIGAASRAATAALAALTAVEAVRTAASTAMLEADAVRAAAWAAMPPAEAARAVQAWDPEWRWQSEHLTEVLMELAPAH